MNKLLEFDKQIAIQQEVTLLIGIDEAGRGPLAGPVVAAACCIAPNQYPAFQDINDSKKLTATKREEIFERMHKLGVLYGVGFASAQEIDELNILQATFLAMRRAAYKFYSIPSAFALVDGPHAITQFQLQQQAVVDGDAKSLNIAAASIIAKVLRDRYMQTLDKIYPDYGFAAHKGYGTAQHLLVLRQKGPCPQHRKTFAPVRDLLAPELF